MARVQFTVKLPEDFCNSSIGSVPMGHDDYGDEFTPTLGRVRDDSETTDACGSPSSPRSASTEIDTKWWLFGVPHVDQDAIWPIDVPEATEVLLGAEASSTSHVESAS